jgi:hypothetical protein
VSRVSGAAPGAWHPGVRVAIRRDAVVAECPIARTPDARIDDRATGRRTCDDDGRAAARVAIH